MSYRNYMGKPGCGYQPPYCPHPQPKPAPCQTHTHEFLGSTMLAGEDIHNHRFAGVSSEEIPMGECHVHAILVNTDFYEDHHHEIGGTSGPPIPVGKGKHIHFVHGFTTRDDNHFHEFIFASLIQDPLTMEQERDKYAAEGDW